MIFGISLFFGTITAIFAYYKWNQRYTMISTGGITGRANAHITNLLVLWVVCTIAYNVIFALLGDLATWLLDHWYIVVGIVVVLGILIKLGSNVITKEEAEKMRDILRQHKDRFYEFAENDFLDYKNITKISHDKNDYVCDTMIHGFDVNDKKDLSDMALWRVRYDFDYSQKTIFFRILSEKNDFNKKYNPLTAELIEFDKNSMDKERNEATYGSGWYEGAIRLYYAATGRRWPENNMEDNVEVPIEDTINHTNTDNYDSKSEDDYNEQLEAIRQARTKEAKLHPKFCQYCGAKLNDKGKFCPHCGKPI